MGDTIIAVVAICSVDFLAIILSFASLMIRSNFCMMFQVQFFDGLMDEFLVMNGDLMKSPKQVVAEQRHHVIDEIERM